jgi:carboxypeptidase C (cathepsin A)
MPKTDTPAQTATKPAPAADPKAYRPPTGVYKELPVRAGAKRMRAGVHADWLLIREHGVPTAEVFFTSYQLLGARPGRPVTFLFNGGPGAASAFLHMGTAGPRRIAFGSGGTVPPPPAQLVDNAESWLAFTDLVFVDPVGTGLSRTVAESKLEQHAVDADDEKADKSRKALPAQRKPFFGVKRDIDVLAEFCSQWLSRFDRWDSPVSIAGESYGGFRVGKLMRALPERGVGLTGAVMVSPAIDFLALDGGDYDVLAWVNIVPTMALTAAYHKRSRGRFRAMSTDGLRAAAQDFAELTLLPLLARGERAPQAERQRVQRELADLIGLEEALVARHNARVPMHVFCRELLRDDNRVCGFYDAAVAGHNVFPDREGTPNPDPTLAGIMSAFTAGINTMLRRELGLQTTREYAVFSEDTWKAWSDDRMSGYWHRQLDCADDMRYGLGMNPALKLFICHGWFDLVTTYFSSQQAVSLLRLPEALRANVTLTNYQGGHMFYSWDASRRAVAADVRPIVTPR